MFSSVSVLPRLEWPQGFPPKKELCQKLVVIWFCLSVMGQMWGWMFAIACLRNQWTALLIVA